MRYLTIFISGIAVGIVFMTVLICIVNNPKVDLPEEYQLITKDTPIQGHFENDKLIIQFKHNF